MKTKMVIKIKANIAKFEGRVERTKHSLYQIHILFATQLLPVCSLNA